MLKKILLIGFVFAWMLGAENLWAATADYAKFFEIDLENDPLPKLEDIEKAFEENDVYNPKYKSFYDLQGAFDRSFSLTTAVYGSTEKRLKSPDEDTLLEFLSQLPKEHYQYFGPMLFEVPNMSEKILTLPGIRETKNKFPTRVAQELKDIKDLEFLSPAYYFLLMPEVWPSYSQKIEMPKLTPYFPKIKYNPKFYAALRKIVKPEKFMPDYQENGKKTKSDLRTLYPTKETLLTSADIKAFMKTVEAVDAWAQKQENKYLLVKVGIMWSAYEQSDESEFKVPFAFLDLANPCARMVQKARLAGKEFELAKLVAPQGFTLNEWAYTCDKTLKAYRLGNISTPVVKVVKEYQRGIYDEIQGLSPYTQKMRYAAMQFMIQSFKAPLSDVLEYRKNRVEFDEMLKKHGFELFGYPVTRF